MREIKRGRAAFWRWSKERHRSWDYFDGWYNIRLYHRGLCYFRYLYRCNGDGRSGLGNLSHTSARFVHRFANVAKFLYQPAKHTSTLLSFIFRLDAINWVESRIDLWYRSLEGTRSRYNGWGHERKWGRYWARTNIGSSPRTLTSQ